MLRCTGFAVFGLPFNRFPPAVPDELPPEQREVFRLTEAEGFSFRELSEDMGIPVATLLSRKGYSVKHLRRRLADLYVALLED